MSILFTPEKSELGSNGNYYSEKKKRKRDSPSSLTLDSNSKSKRRKAAVFDLIAKPFQSLMDHLRSTPRRKVLSPSRTHSTSNPPDHSTPFNFTNSRVTVSDSKEDEESLSGSSDETSLYPNLPSLSLDDSVFPLPRDKPKLWEDLKVREERTSMAQWRSQLSTQLRETSPMVSRDRSLSSSIFTSPSPSSPPTSSSSLPLNRERRSLSSSWLPSDQGPSFQPRFDRSVKRNSFGHSLEVDLTKGPVAPSPDFQKLLKEHREREMLQHERAVLAKREALRDLSQKYQERHRPAPRPFPPLHKEAEEAVKSAFDGPSDEIVATGVGGELTRELVQCLRPQGWLNDEVINAYLVLLSQRSQKNSSYPKCHIFNTFFYPMLSDRGYSRVRTWTRKAKVDIFSMDKVIVPVHLGSHWCLAVINLKKRQFEYYDSLGGHNPGCLRILREYLKEEHKDKKGGKEIDLSDWTDVHPSPIPQQENYYDCGMFMCRYAECATRDKPFDFSQENMPYFRKRMLWDLLQKTFSA